MQNPLKFLLSSCLAAVAMALTACSDDQSPVATVDVERTLTVESSVIDMLARTVSHDGSYDNIVDGASCMGIRFPYTVIVNDVELRIATIKDFEEIEKILDTAEAEQALNGTHDLQQSVAIRFPVMATLSDQTEVVIESQAAFEAYAKACVEGVEDYDIECIDLTYPIVLFTYNPDLQQTGSATVDDDQQLRRFLAGLAETELISLEFPLILIAHDSTQIEVRNNTALADAMQSVIDSCDEDDDADYNDDDFTKESLDSLLVNCPWSLRIPEPTMINSAMQSQEDFLAFLEDGTLVFEDDTVVSEEGTLVSTEETTTVKQGTWSVGVNDFEVFVTLELQDAPELSGTRYTYNIGQGLIKMDGGENGILLLEQRCDIEY